MEFPSLVATAAQLRNQHTSAVDLARHCAAQVRARDAGVQAWAAFNEERALDLAAACDASKSYATPLHGVPLGVKDIIDTVDWPTARGSAAYEGRQPGRDAEVVRRLKAAGAYVFGKTVTTEFAYMHPGKTRNPWNGAHTPGGSSSGSAAAVACGMVPGAIGTQTNGSVIRPAAFCGVVGFKPGFGLIPFTGVMQFSSTLDQLGTFTRNVADAALLASVLVEGEAVSPEVAMPAAPPRIAVIADFPWTRAEPEAAAQLKAVLGRLSAAGASVSGFAFPQSCADARDTQRTIMMAEAARENGGRQDRHRALLSAKLNAGIDEGRAITDAALLAALLRRAVISEQALDWFEDCDVIASLPAPGVAPSGLAGTGDPSYCTLWSLTGFPAISLPTGFSAVGLPHGLQLVARPGAEDRLLSVAAWCERALA